jgi:hypothetical protein
MEFYIYLMCLGHLYDCGSGLWRSFPIASKQSDFTFFSAFAGFYPTLVRMMIVPCLSFGPKKGAKWIKTLSPKI